MKQNPLAQRRRLHTPRLLYGQHMVRIAVLLCAICAALSGALGRPQSIVYAASPSTAPSSHATRPATQPLGPRRQAEGDWFRLKHLGKKLPPADALIKAFEQAQRMKHAPTSPSSSTGSSAVASATTPVLGVWTALGPSPIQSLTCCQTELDSGRITSLAVNPTNSDEVWAGAADGGLWHSGNGGAAWAPVTDGEDTLAVGAIAIDPVNPRTIYIGTGEGNSDGDNYWGIGILKSTDNGQTWTRYGYNQFAGLSIARLVIDPADTQTILAAVTPMYSGSSTGGSVPPADSQYPGAPSLANLGIWRSVDGGQTWNQVITTDSPSPSVAGTDIAFDPADPNIVFAAMGGVIARSSKAGIWKSTNSGQTFTQIVSSGLPDPISIKRIAFGVSLDGTHIYAAMSDNGPQSTQQQHLLLSGRRHYLGLAYCYRSRHGDLSQ